MNYFVEFEKGKVYEVNIDRIDASSATVRIGSNCYPIFFNEQGHRVCFHIHNRVFNIHMDERNPEMRFSTPYVRWPVLVESARTRAISSAAAKAHHTSAGIVTSPMPGKVLKVLTEVGAPITKGTALVVVEAMKMENELLSPVDGVVSKIHVEVGATVVGKQKLIEIRSNGA